MNEVQKGVQDFHERYGCFTRYEPTLPDFRTLLLRASLIVEESSEFMKAARNADMVGMTDALADLLYVTYGTAVVMGLDMEPISAEVQRSNMTKDGGGQDSGGKIMKGPDFRPPDIAKKLQEQGWNE
ncbi:MAG: pyrophosphohydrolase domain-containing protein [Promethearchaeota archaeon]|jgi:predicted HAD superfamily Cof-like phosphohydrolase